MKNKILCIFALLMLCAASVMAQTIKVKGTIVAKVDGEPLMVAASKPSLRMTSISLTARNILTNSNT